MKNGSKVKVRIELVGANQILFQVLEMDERFRASESYKEHMLNSDEFKIFRSVSSMDNPAIGGSSDEYGDGDINIWLRGCLTSSDFRVTLWDSSSLNEALKFIIELKKALKDWAENWEGFQDKEPKNVQESDNLTIFEF